jgi:hypothetical protein
MDTYALDVETPEIRDEPVPSGGSYFSNYHKYYFKIDKNGNVNVKSIMINHTSGHPPQSYPIKEELVITDNIHIPDYLLDGIKYHISMLTGHYVYRSHYLILINLISHYKKSLKEQVENPQNIRDLTINTYKEEIKRLKWEIESKNNIISEKDKSLSNKVVAETKLVQDLRAENTELYELVARLKGKETPKTSSNSWYSYSREPEYKNTLSTCWSNPGGATICTQSNAQNSMVYNESSGIYEPGY